jgi:hypothetical protein
MVAIAVPVTSNLATHQRDELANLERWVRQQCVRTRSSMHSRQDGPVHLFDWPGGDSSDQAFVVHHVRVGVFV